MSSNAPPNYYSILSIPTTATQTQIREAYKRAALKSHPDRVPVSSPERPERTRKFQAINDAYYTLSDPGRRRDYDAVRAGFGRGNAYAFDPQDEEDEEFEEDDDEEEEETEHIPRKPKAKANAKQSPFSAFTSSFPFSAFGFGQGGASATGTSNSDAQFGDIFEEMLRDEGMAEGGGGAAGSAAGKAKPTGKFWALVGGVSGGAMGFIVANLPGAVAGAVAGNRLGAVRDARGKSVYEVFGELSQGDKARLLGELAKKVFANAVGS